jgi:GT2 family glycosyltransferase
MNDDVVPVSVVIPTIGRPELLRSSLDSLAACSPRAAEILVVDQSGEHAVAESVAGFTSIGARLLPCSGRGVSRGRNVGIRAARHEIVLVTDDDCTVACDWIAVAWNRMAADRRQIVTGQVRPAADDPRSVPSVKVEPSPHDYTGTIHGGALFPNNMALNRDLVLAAGGFDERFRPSEAAEDNEFCYRWLKAGYALRYDPALVVWHHDWRTPEQLENLYHAYARGQGFLYAKHLRGGDLRMLAYMARDVHYALRALASAAVRGRERWTDPRRAIPRGLPAGLWYGVKVFWLGERGRNGRTERVQGLPS